MSLLLWSFFFFYCRLVNACTEDYPFAYGNYCYNFHYEKTNFWHAENTCVKEGGHLVSILSKHELDWINQSMPLAGTWIGLLHDNVSDTLFWSDESSFVRLALLNSSADRSCFTPKQEFTWEGRDCGAYQASFICKKKHQSCPFDQIDLPGVCIDIDFYLSDWWDHAERICSNGGGHLASIHNEDTDRAILENAIANKYTDNVHIGLNAGNWTDGTPYDYRNFAPNHPDPSLGNCTSLVVYGDGASTAPGQWISTKCTGVLAHYACQNDFAPPTDAPDLCPSEDFIFYTPIILYSPGYPESMRTPFMCKYVIVGPEGNFVSATFVDFAVDNGQLMIYDGMDGNNVVASINGLAYIGASYQTNSTNVMRLQWNSLRDGMRGWHAFFMTHPTTSSSSNVGGETATQLKFSRNLYA